MFYGASSFNQDISAWNVSNSNRFVSIVKNDTQDAFNFQQVLLNLMPLRIIKNLTIIVFHLVVEMLFVSSVLYITG